MQQTNDARSASDEGYLDARETVVGLWRARWSILAAVVVCALGGFLVGSRQPREYEAVTRLRAVSAINGNPVLLPPPLFAMLKGPELAAAVQGAPASGPGAATPPATLTELPPSGVSISVRATDPAAATGLADRYAAAAVELARNANRQAAARADAFLAGRVAAAKDRLEAARSRLLEQGGAKRSSAPPSVQDDDAVQDPPRERRYSASDAEFDRYWLDAKIAEREFRNASIRRAEYLEQLEWGGVELAVVERAPAATPLSRGRVRKAALGAAIGGLLSVLAVFALLIVRPAAASLRSQA
jgi:hypothetical protein